MLTSDIFLSTNQIRNSIKKIKIKEKNQFDPILIWNHLPYWKITGLKALPSRHDTMKKFKLSNKNKLNKFNANLLADSWTYVFVHLIMTRLGRKLSRVEYNGVHTT